MFPGRFRHPRTRRFNMRNRWLTLFAMVLVATALATLSGAQAPRVANGNDVTKGSLPRTPWGHPDLQGVWTTDAEIGVPVERPVEFGEKALLTDQELEQRAQRLKKLYSDNREDRVVRAGSTGAGPEHW